MIVYRVKVEKAEYVTRKAGKEWKIIDKDQHYGYTPEIEKEVWETNEIYNQLVNDLNMAALVSVVNKLNNKGD